MENQNNDLFSKLQGILSTKEGQEQLKNISAMFSSPQSQQANSPPPQPDQSNNNSSQGNQSQGGGSLDMNAISSLLQGFMGGQNNNSNDQTNQSTGFGDPQSPLGNIDMGMILNLQQVFQSMNKNDKNTDLLLALKPHFSEKRRKKVDQAISMMRLLAMLPTLKESGIFAGL